MDTCDKHSEMVSNVAVITERLSNIVESQERVEKFFAKHVEEGEKAGGFRDRLVVVELAVTTLSKEISALKTAKWITAVVSGLIGGLLSQILPETIELIVKTIFR